MGEEIISQEFRLKNIEKTNNYFIEEISQNKLMIRKLEKACTTLNYIKHLHILASVVTGCFSNFAFASLVDIHVCITSSAVGLKI